MTVFAKPIRIRLIGLALVASAASAPAAADAGGCASLVGTWLITSVDREHVFASRGLLTLGADGTLLMTDSAQGGVPGIHDPTGPIQGSWRCLEPKDGPARAAAVGLGFVHPEDGHESVLARTDYRLAGDTNNNLLHGESTLGLAEGHDLEAADPLARRPVASALHHFSGRRVVPDDGPLELRPAPSPDSEQQ